MPQPINGVHLRRIRIDPVDHLRPVVRRVDLSTLLTEVLLKMHPQVAFILLPPVNVNVERGL